MKTMKTKAFYVVFGVLLAMFLIIKGVDGSFVFAGIAGDLSQTGGLSSDTQFLLGKYLLISLPQLFVLVGGFAAQLILCKFGLFDAAKLVGILKYALLPISYMFYMRWFIGNIFTLYLVLPFAALIILGIALESALLGREERAVKKTAASSETVKAV